MKSLVSALVVLVLVLHTKMTGGSLVPKPVGFWRLNEEDGAADRSNRGNFASLKNVNYVEGPYGDKSGAIQFTGAETSYVKLPNNGALDVRQAFTWMAWVKFQSYRQGSLFTYEKLRPGTSNSPDDRGTFFMQYGSNSHSQLHGALNERETLARKHSANTVIATSLDVWVHLAVTYDGSMIRAFVNWTEKSDFRFSTSILLETIGDVYLGSSYPIRPVSTDTLEAHMACVQLYDVALSGEQMRMAEEGCKALDNAFTRYSSIYPHPTWAFYMPKGGSRYNAAGDRLQLITWTGAKSVVFKGMNAVYLDGIGSHGQINAHPSTQSFSWCGYFYSLGEKGPILDWFLTTSTTSTYSSHFWAYPTADQFYAVIRTSTLSSIGLVKTGIIKDSWNFLGVTYDYVSGVFKIYINGVMADTKNWGSNQMNFVGKIWIGRRFIDGRRLKGYFSCFQFFDVALSAESLERVRQRCLFFNDQTRLRDGMVGFWRLNQQKKLSSEKGIGNGYTISKKEREGMSYVTGPRKRRGEAVQIDQGISSINKKRVFTVGDAMTYLAYVNLSKMNGTAHLIYIPDADISLYLKSTGELIYQIRNRASSQYTMRLTKKGYSNVTSDGWIHVGVVYDNLTGVTHLYKDDEKLDVMREPLPPLPVTRDFHRFQIFTSNRAQLQISCVQLFNRALTAPERISAKAMCDSKALDKGADKVPLPVGFWPLNKKFEGRELTGRAIPFTFGPNAKFTDQDGPFPGYKALEMDGTSDSCGVAYPAAAGVKHSHTVALWAKPTGKAGNAPSMINWRNVDEFGTSHDEINGNIFAFTTEERVHLRLRYRYGFGKSDVNYKRLASGKFPKGKWTFVAYTYDYVLGVSKIYIDGKLATTNGWGNYIQRTQFELYLGCTNAGEQFFLGGLTCLQIYDTALTAREIKQAMLKCQGRAQTPTPRGTFEAPVDAPKGHIQTAVNRTVSARFLGECLAHCYAEETCQAVNFGNRTCDLCEHTYSDSPETFESSDEKTHFELTKEADSFA